MLRFTKQLIKQNYNKNLLILFETTFSFEYSRWNCSFATVILTKKQNFWTRKSQVKRKIQVLIMYHHRSDSLWKKTRYYPFKNDFIYVQEHPLLLCGKTNKEIKKNVRVTASGTKKV